MVLLWNVKNSDTVNGFFENKLILKKVLDMLQDLN